MRVMITTHQQQQKTLSLISDDFTTKLTFHMPHNDNNSGDHLTQNKEWRFFQIKVENSLSRAHQKPNVHSLPHVHCDQAPQLKNLASVFAARSALQRRGGEWRRLLSAFAEPLLSVCPPVCLPVLSGVWFLLLLLLLLLFQQFCCCVFACCCCCCRLLFSLSVQAFIARLVFVVLVLGSSGVDTTDHHRLHQQQQHLQQPPQWPLRYKSLSLSFF